MNEIEIYCKYEDMSTVCTVLKANNVEFEFDPECENMIPRIYTDDTTRAVQIINTLGYGTDEDSYEE